MFSVKIRVLWETSSQIAVEGIQDIDIFEVVNLAAVSPYILYNTLKSDKAYKLILSFAFREFIES